MTPIQKHLNETVEEACNGLIQAGLTKTAAALQVAVIEALRPEFRPLDLVPRNDFGTKRYYPHCEKAKLLAKFAYCNSFIEDQVMTMHKLGFEIRFVCDSDNLNGILTGLQGLKASKSWYQNTFTL